MEERIKDDLKEAQLARDEVKVSTLRLLLSELTYAKVAKGEDLTDQEIVTVVQKEIKKRREAAEGFRRGNREDQALKEEAEAKILGEYLPPQLSNEELTKIVQDTITELGANSTQDMGRVIGLVKSKVGQGAPGSTISQLVREKLW